MTIRIKKKIDSETIYLPELRQMIGKTVDITVQEETEATPKDEFRNPPSLDEIIARHDAGPRHESTGYQFTEADFEGFDEALAQWRREGAIEAVEGGA